MNEVVAVRIDGKTVDAPAGSTILQAAKLGGIHIPTLCYSPVLLPLENCRLCIVSVAGEKQYKAACSTAVVDKMDISTQSEDLQQARKLLLELLLDTHYGDCVAPCTMNCPANVDIQGYLALIRKGEYRAAVALIKEKIPMPLTIGRVCPHFCESVCRRHLVEEPININHCKRFVADVEMESGIRILPEVPPSTGKRVAIIGGGPAGLSCAYYLRTKGHEATIFEAKDKLGGMTRYGIPEYRLPKAILDWEIDGILSLGVEVRKKVRWGKDFTIEDLKKEGFDAIFVGIGAWSGNKLSLEGEDMPGVLSGIGFLDDVASGKAPKLGKHVMVIGGGNTAIDAARTSIRLGVEKVTVLYRRSRKEMPANPEEIIAAEHEKVDIQLLAAPTRLIGENGVLKQIEYLRMELGEPDASGRRRPVPVKGSETVVDVDQVINAIGQFPTMLKPEQDGIISKLSITRWSTIDGDAMSQFTGHEAIFTGGDSFRGPQTVVAALADGRKAAYAIDQYFTLGAVKGEPVSFNISRGDLKTMDAEPLRVMMNAPRQRMPELPVEKAIKGFDQMELGLSEKQAKDEAERCLICGCAAAFDCRLRDAMDDFSIPSRSQPDKKIHYTQVQKVDVHPLISFDPNKCIRCERCHVGCAKFQCSDAIDLHAYPSFNEKCVQCGLCMDLCPTGALMMKDAGRPLDRLDWRSENTRCIHCGVGCELDLKFKGERLVWISDLNYSNSKRGSTCKQGRFKIYDPIWYGTRVLNPATGPKKLAKNVSMPRAIEALLKGFKSVTEKYGPKALAALGSPRFSNEALYLLQRWMRTGYKTNGIDFPGRAARESLLTMIQSNAGLKSVNQALPGLERAEAIFICGNNIEEAAPVVATMIRRGARVRKIPLWQLSSQADGLTSFASVAIHGGPAHWKGMLEGLAGAEFTPSDDGISVEKWQALKREFDAASGVAFVFPEAMLVSADTSDVAKAFMKLAGKSGSAVQENGGLFAVTPDINNSGALLMGVSPNMLPGFVSVTDYKAARRIEGAWDASELPMEPFAAVEKALHAQHIKGLFVQDAAYLFEKDAEKWQRLLSQVEFLVVQEIVPSPALDLAQVVLPSAGFGEQVGTVLNMEGRLLGLRRVFAPQGLACEDWKVIAQIMAAQGLTFPKDLDAIRQEISALVPELADVKW
jgi:formate dehydrogenase major subunit